MDSVIYPPLGVNPLTTTWELLIKERLKKKKMWLTGSKAAVYKLFPS
jgi:hypothetical protein